MARKDDEHGADDAYEKPGKSASPWRSRLITLVLGLSALAPPAGIPVSEAALTIDIPVMIAVAVACLPIFFAGYAIARWEGALFVFYYIAYTTYLILEAVDSSWSHPLEVMMVGFVIPLTVITLLVTTFRAFRKKWRVAGSSGE